MRHGSSLTRSRGAILHKSEEAVFPSWYIENKGLEITYRSLEDVTAVTLLGMYEMKEWMNLGHPSDDKDCRSRGTT